MNTPRDVYRKGRTPPGENVRAEKFAFAWVFRESTPFCRGAWPGLHGSPGPRSLYTFDTWEA